MDPVTAKTLVSASLVFAIVLFSLISVQALLAQIAADLRDAQAHRLKAVARGADVDPSKHRRA